MEIVGKIIKRTAAVAYKRNLNRGLAFEHQIDVLHSLLDKARTTNFGRHHRFNFMLKRTSFLSLYQQYVPIMDYDQFYEAWLKHSIDGVRSNTWPGVINHYALSSGTTAASKRLPITKKFIRSFQKMSMRQISTLHKLDLPALFFQKSILVVGGSSELIEIHHRFEGDLSGILKKYTAPVVTPFTQPGKQIASIKSWVDKLEAMVEAAPNWDIGVVAGVPSWCAMLIEKIIKRHNLKSIHDIWPNFHVYVHGGIFLEPYLHRFEKVFGQKVHFLNTYLASEGYFAYQKNPEHEGMALLLNSGTFYEFIPFDEEHFTPEGNIRNPHFALSINDVEANRNYALVISTNAGLWRYLLGDLVSFTSVQKREIKITGRIQQYLSHCGEHLSVDNINSAVLKTAEDLKVDIEEFCVFANTETDVPCHEWFIGTDTPEKIDVEKFRSSLDKMLKIVNDDYESVRKATLDAPKIHIFPITVFYDYMKYMGKFGSQNKFPKVMTKTQAEPWLTFLSERIK
jgi:phenylacetate-coenzyme A ligase PaaK-like adenylate-forming protein